MSARASMRVALASALAAITISSSCGILRTRDADARPAFWEHRPRCVHVRIESNRSDEPAAAGIVRSHVERGLEELGYSVAPRGDAVATAGDATLGVVIDRFRRQAEPFAGRARVGVSLEAELRDRVSGELLWSALGVAHEEPEDDEDAETDLLGSLLEYGLEQAIDPLPGAAEEVAADAVADLLRTLPRADATAP